MTELVGNSVRNRLPELRFQSGLAHRAAKQYPS
jgi:hypothetical protein